MAYENSISALPAPAHPMANPGYGKRAAPGEPGQARRTPDFGHLPPREAYVAAFVDRLPEGAAMDVKSLAKVLPLYGQQAVGSALNALSRAGHLRRVRRLAETGDTGTRWVFRTHWSRVARDDEWWARYLTGDDASGAAEAIGANGLDVPVASVAVASPRAAAAAPGGTTGPPAPAPVRSVAYRALARLGRIDGRLTLSAADCAYLAEPAAAWFERGATEDSFTSALTNGLPDVVHAPRALLARRLRDKLPPEPAAAPDPEPSLARGPRRTILECTECGVPGRPQALPGGLCGACAASRGGEAGPSATPSVTADSLPDVRRHVSRIRAAIATRRDRVGCDEPGLLFSR